MANVFLDLGTHYGQGLSHFISRFGIDNTWTVHTFEANPATYQVFLNGAASNFPFVVHHNEAVSDHDGMIIVNQETPPGEGAVGMGSSVIDLDNWNPWGSELRENFVSSAEVPCIDFSRFIRDNFSPEDNIIVKMDIEGSEFPVIQNLIDTDTLKYINHLTVEWHPQFFVNKDEKYQLRDSLREQIINQQIVLEDWH